MKFSLAFIALTFTVALMPHSVPAAAQSRPLTPADFPKVSPQAPVTEGALRGLKGKALVERVLLTPDDGATLRLALSLASPDFVKGTNVEALIAALATLRAESAKQLLPAVLAPIDAREKPQARLAPEPRAAGLMAAAIRSEPVTWPLPAVLFAAVGDDAASAEWPSQPQTYTGVNEYEIVTEGKTANVREEITFLFETRQVGIRQVKRETVESNGDPTAVGSYVVEQGTVEPATGVSTVKTSHARRLRPTSTDRVTTEIIREAKVDRCPDAAGLIRGATHASAMIRATAAAGGGSPSLMESVARGTVIGRVNDAANLAGFDLTTTSETRMEALNLGENFRFSDSVSLRFTGMEDGGTLGFTGSTGERKVSGAGSEDAARRMLSLHDSVGSDAHGPLLMSFDTAEAQWRGGACVELTVSSGAAPKELKSGESRKVVVDARHRYDPEPPAIPVTAQPSGGAVTPSEPVKTPAAAITFKSDGGNGGGLVTFNSISRRGIARDISASFDPVEDDALLIRYVYSGFKFVDSTAEDCPTMRTSGQEVLTARVRLVRSSDGSTVYTGTGRFSADIDGCGLTPDRKDPGSTANGTGFGGFSGDNFLGCKVTTVAPEREVRVTLDLLVYDDPQYLKIEWTPIGRPPDVRVTSTCEPPWHAEFVKNLTVEYGREKREEITDLEPLRQMVLRGGLRPGTYQQPDATSEGRWTLTVTKAKE